MYLLEKISTAEFLPAELKKYKNYTCIEFYVFCPEEGRMRRKRIKVDGLMKRYASKTEAKRHVNRIVFELNQKLKSGWNPYLETASQKEYVRFDSRLFDCYLQEKTKELREASVRSYKSFLKIFADFLKAKNIDCFTSTFSEQNAKEFSRYVYIERNVSAVCHNNYIKQARVFFNWMVENGNARENVFGHVKPKRADDKKRILIPEECRRMITEYFRMHDRRMLLVCHLVFFSLIRRTELTKIKIKDISVEESTITVRGENAKNHHRRTSAISDDIKQQLLDMHIENYPPEYYLFSRNGVPGEERLNPNRFTKIFAKCREKLNLPEEMQLYSFRDTGITEMIKSGVDDLTVMQHADHSDLSITSRYARHADECLKERIRNSGLKF